MKRAGLRSLLALNSTVGPFTLSQPNLLYRVIIGIKWDTSGYPCICWLEFLGGRYVDVEIMVMATGRLLPHNASV